MRTFLEWSTYLESFWGKKGGGVLVVANNTSLVPNKPILIAHRSSQVMEPNTYGLWGGKLDIDTFGMSRPQLRKAAYQAAKREFSEESRFSGKLTYIKNSLWANEIKDENGIVVFEYFNYLVAVEDQFEPRLNWETDKFYWVDWNQLWSLPKPVGRTTMERRDNNEPNQMHFGLYEYLLKKGRLVQSVVTQLSV